MSTRVQTIHEKNIIYRGISPENPLLRLPGTHTTDIIHMIDFDIDGFYRDLKTKQHIPYRDRKSLSETARYMSINTHLGREQSRRNDLENLGHVFIFFLRVRGNHPCRASSSPPPGRSSAQLARRNR
ncbi:hypothetical protein RSAG8_11291, partial [Rhizoctonia solani AG-8 WAC10335]